MRKYLFVISFCLLNVYCFAQQISYDEWKERAKTNIALLPEYGKMTKTAEQISADKEFIKNCITQDGTREKASEHLVRLGFDYLYKGDISTAMHRFNQAWLLNPANENAYWGFGAIYFTFYDKQEALKQYDKGLAINPKSSNILTDKATVYMMVFQREGGKDNLLKAIQFFTDSYAIDPKNQNTLFKLSVAYFLNDDCINAKRYHKECKELGGEVISEEYTAALNQKCKN